MTRGGLAITSGRPQSIRETSRVVDCGYSSEGHTERGRINSVGTKPSPVFIEDLRMASRAIKNLSRRSAMHVRPPGADGRRQGTLHGTHRDLQAGCRRDPSGRNRVMKERTACAQLVGTWPQEFGVISKKMIGQFHAAASAVMKGPFTNRPNATNGGCACAFLNQTNLWSARKSVGYILRRH